MFSQRTTSTNLSKVKDNSETFVWLANGLCLNVDFVLVSFPDEFEDAEETNLSGSHRIVPPPHSVTPPEEDDYPVNYTAESKNQDKQDPQQAFVIEFFDDSQRKKRTQSFTNNMSSPDFQSALKNKLDKRKGTNASAGHNPPTQQFTIPLKGSDGSQRAGSLRREKSEIRMSTSDFSSRSTGKPFGSVGRRSKLAQDFARELQRISKTASASTWKHNSSESNLNTASEISSSTLNGDSPVTHQSLPTTSHSNSHSLNQTLSTSLYQPSTPLNSSSVHMDDDSIDVKAAGPKQEEEDSLSDAGTYTIEAEGPDKDVVEARSMIDQVQTNQFGLINF